MISLCVSRIGLCTPYYISTQFGGCLWQSCTAANRCAPSESTFSRICLGDLLAFHPICTTADAGTCFRSPLVHDDASPRWTSTGRKPGHGETYIMIRRDGGGEDNGWLQQAESQAPSLHPRSVGNELPRSRLQIAICRSPFALLHPSRARRRPNSIPDLAAVHAGGSPFRTFSEPVSLEGLISERTSGINKE